MDPLFFPNTEKLLFFRSINAHPVMLQFKKLNQNFNQHRFDDDSAYFEIKSFLLNLALQETDETAFAPAPWQHFILSQILACENPLTLSMEKGIIEEPHPLMANFLHDMKILSDLFSFNWNQLIEEKELDDDRILSQPIFSPGEKRKTLSDIFGERNPKAVFDALNAYIIQNGLGIFEKSRRFKIDHLHRPVPIKFNKTICMDHLFGYEAQKKALMENTTAFVKKNLGLNVLLQGDMGTGKSTMVKALLHEFANENLKMIELKRNQLPVLPEIMSFLSGRPYSFIIFIDDLSFDDNDENFMLFKNCLEGSLEDTPNNIRIYATSNKRHLITETMSERDDAVHAGDIIQEKLSLSARFGLIITFSIPDQKEYLNIVHQLAKGAGLDIETEKLDAAALKWEIRHLNRSGRTAAQFIQSLLSQ